MKSHRRIADIKFLTSQKKYLTIDSVPLAKNQIVLHTPYNKFGIPTQ